MTSAVQACAATQRAGTEHAILLMWGGSCPVCAGSTRNTVHFCTESVRQPCLCPTAAVRAAVCAPAPVWGGVVCRAACVPDARTCHCITRSTRASLCQHASPSSQSMLLPAGGGDVHWHVVHLDAPARAAATTRSPSHHASIHPAGACHHAGGGSLLLCVVAGTVLYAVTTTTTFAVEDHQASSHPAGACLPAGGGMHSCR